MSKDQDFLLHKDVVEEKIRQLGFVSSAQTLETLNKGVQIFLERFKKCALKLSNNRQLKAPQNVQLIEVSHPKKIINNIAEQEKQIREQRAKEEAKDQKRKQNRKRQREEDIDEINRAVDDPREHKRQKVSESGAIQQRLHQGYSFISSKDLLYALEVNPSLTNRQFLALLKMKTNTN